MEPKEETMKTLTAAVAALAAAAIAASAAGAGGTNSLLIRHQVRGCHAWSLNGGPFRPAQTTRAAVGSTLVVTDNDVMPHLLFQKSGPAATIRAHGNGTPMHMKVQALHGPGAMNAVGASVSVTFPKAGVYTFQTKAGEDYMAGVKTIGEDNVLTLKVVVR
jgi:hypothetical protein